MIELSSTIEKEALTITEDEDSARFVEIIRNNFNCNLTIGGIYEIKRSYDSNYLSEEDPAMYIIDDNEKPLFCFEVLCGTKFYT